MGEIIWVEILSRHRDVEARHRCTGPEIRVGRGYSNDVVIDDPYVAPAHLRIVRSEDGSLVAEDLGSIDGLHPHPKNKTVRRIVLDGDRTIRIGRTLLRIRTADHVVSPERAAKARPAIWLPIAALAAALLGIEALSQWLSEIGEPKPARYLLPLLGLSLFVLGWSGGWTILSRVFSGRPGFERHLRVALAGLLALSLLDEVAGLSAYALAWHPAPIWRLATMWGVLGGVCFLHLRQVGPSRLALKGGVMAALACLAIAMQALWQAEARPNAERSQTRRLYPPAMRLRSPESESTFFAEVEALKGKLDRARTQEPSASDTGSVFDADD